MISLIKRIRLPIVPTKEERGEGEEEHEEEGEKLEELESLSSCIVFLFLSVSSWTTEVG